MAIDYRVSLYDPIYTTLGVPAVLSIPGSFAVDIDLTVIDKTKPKQSTEREHHTKHGVRSAVIDLETIEPYVCVRAYELDPLLALASFDRSALDDSGIVFNGASWSIKAVQSVPAPTGEAEGEYKLILVSA